MNTLKTTLLTSVITMGALATGCQTITHQAEAPVQTNQTMATYTITNQALQANNWQLIDAQKRNGEKVDELLNNSARPLTLNFMQVEGNNIVSLMNTCNNISSSYSINNGVVKLGNIMTTMKACPDTEAKRDAAAVATVMGEYTLSQDANKHPILVITNNSQVSHFKAVPKTN